MSPETRFPLSSWPYLVLDSILKVTMIVPVTLVICFPDWQDVEGGKGKMAHVSLKPHTV